MRILYVYRVGFVLTNDEGSRYRMIERPAASSDEAVAGLLRTIEHANTVGKVNYAIAYEFHLDDQNEIVKILAHDVIELPKERDGEPLVINSPEWKESDTAELVGEDCDGDPTYWEDHGTKDFKRLMGPNILISTDLAIDELNGLIQISHFAD